MPVQCAEEMAEKSDLWVFGYGSLMWRPDFPHAARREATLFGAHRSLCIYSHVHRGTPERPGLVLGLDRGGACRGVAFRIAGSDAAGVTAYLREREQTTAVYREVARPVRFADGGAATALCYVVERGHPQYAGVLALEEQHRLVRQGRGQSGPNVDYVLNTVRHLDELGIADARLKALARLLGNQGRASARTDLLSGGVT